VPSPLLRYGAVPESTIRCRTREHDTVPYQIARCGAVPESTGVLCSLRPTARSIRPRDLCIAINAKNMKTPTIPPVAPVYLRKDACRGIIFGGTQCTPYAICSFPLKVKPPLDRIKSIAPTVSIDFFTRMHATYVLYVPRRIVAVLQVTHT
jgi:hypothetical protein